METTNEINRVFIVGAGFSHNAGLPLGNEFTKAILDVEGFPLDSQSTVIVKFLKYFVENTFGHRQISSIESWPALEDIFTCIDLSANTGHHLGKKFPPSHLRTVRRGFITRILRMLYRRLNDRKKTPEMNLENLNKLFSNVNLRQSAFLSLNWDTVIEDGLRQTQKIYNYNYGCAAFSAKYRAERIVINEEPVGATAIILKPHGSINWLYCDSCRNMFWFSPSQVWELARHGFRESDWVIIEEHKIKRGKPQKRLANCPKCDSQSLGTRLATFSYRKAIDFPALDATWRKAETLLRSSEKWIFIGYSLPAADYEFKYLLKQVLLSRKKPPEIILITGGGSKSADETVINYRKFFGCDVIKEEFANGLNEDALKAII